MIWLGPPSLNHLQVNTVEDPFNGEEKVAWVDDLPWLFPHLSRLVVVGANELIEMYEVLDDTLPLLTSLRCIKLTGILLTDELIDTLAHFPVLEEL